MNITRRIKPAHLRLIVAIADNEQLGRAADSLAISQPSASRALAELESLLDSQLFIRHPKYMEPTEAGKAIIHHGRKVVAELEGLEQAFKNAVEGYSGQVRVGTVTGPGAKFVIPGLSQAQEQFPEIELTVEVAPSTALVRGLKEGVFDFIVGRLGSDDNPQEFLLEPVAPEVVKLCVGPNHPLYNSQTVSLSQLTVYRWILQERGSPIRKAIETSFLNNGLQPPRKVTNSSALLANLAFLLNSNAIVPLSAEVLDLLTNNTLNLNVRALPIDENILVPQAYLVRNAQTTLSRAALQVLRLVKESMDRL